MSSLLRCYIDFSLSLSYFFFFNDTTTTEIYTLSLHDALPIFHNEYWLKPLWMMGLSVTDQYKSHYGNIRNGSCIGPRSEEHTSELQSHSDLVCRLLLEKKKNTARE